MEVIFESSEVEAGGAQTFVFRPSQPMHWIAGQSIKIEVQGTYGPLEHRFTIASAPYERTIAITTRLSGSPYKNALARLQAGDSAKAYGLEGSFIWRESDLPLLFIAGGIGITPYHSMIKQRLHDGLPIPAMLLYASSTVDIPFKTEFDRWQQEHHEFAVHYLVGQRPQVTDILDPQEHLIYISGPSAMVDELSAEFLRCGVPESQLVRDWFTGHLPTGG